MKQGDNIQDKRPHADKASVDIPIAPASVTELFQNLSSIASIVVFAGGVLVLVGWLGNIGALTRLFLSPLAMKANTAIAFILTGLSLWLLQNKRISGQTRLISKSLALTAASIGFLTLLEFLFDMNIGIDQALIADIPNAPLTSSPGRMSPVTAIEFILIGTALFLTDVEIRNKLRPSQFSSIAALLIAFLSVFGHIYGIESVLRLSQNSTVIALQTSLLSIIAGAGLLLARPNKGIMIFFTKDSPGSIMARRLFVATIIAPLLTDMVLSAYHHFGLLSTVKMEAFHTIITIIIVTGIFLQSALYINKLDDARKKAEEERESVERFPSEAPNPVIRIDRELNILYKNNAAKQMFLSLGFDDKDDSWIADETWNSLIADALNSGQESDIEITTVEKTFLFTVVPVEGMDYINIYGHDISKRKLLENMLQDMFAINKKEKDKAQMYLDIAEVMIIVILCDGTVALANRKACEILEYEPSEIIGTNWFTNYIPERLCANMKSLSTSMMSGESESLRDYECTIITKTGAERIILWHNSQIKNEAGTMIGNLSSGTDITRMRATEARYQRIVELAQDGIWELDSNRITTFVNNKMADMLGYTVEEMIGTEVFRFMDDAHKDFLRKEFSLRKQGEAKQYDFEFIHKDGATIYAIVSGSPVMVAGNFKGSLAFIKNITERRVSEIRSQKLFIAIEQSFAEVAITDTEGSIEYVNPRFTEVTGYDPEEVIGKNCRILKSGLTPPETYDTLWKTITSGQKWQGELTNKKKDGSLYVEKLLISPIKDHNECISGFVAVKEDITEKKMKENQLVLYERQAKMGEMLSVIAHQWRQPIAAISATVNRMELEAVLGTLEKDILRESFSKIRFQLQHLSQTIDDFKSFLKPDIFKVSTDIAHIIEKSLRIIEIHFETSGIRIEHKRKPDIQVNTYADQLVQVFLCVFENAKDAFEDRKTNFPCITIDVYRDNTYVVIMIDDNAGGIAPEQLDKIFLPYFTTKTALKGTGLGLYMAKMIVEEHCGGIISAHNKGNGTSFTIEIPAKN